MPDIAVTAVEDKAGLDAFIQLPKRLFAGQTGYVPPLDLERREALSARHNPLFQHLEARFFLARRAGRVVGRISAQVDRAYLQRYADATGHFGCLVALDDPAIFAALFDAAESWLRGKGMKRVTGPFSLSINEEVGLLVAGFDAPSSMMVPWDPPYAGARVEASGYGKLKDLYSYDYDIQTAPETSGKRLLARGGLAGRVKVRSANVKFFDAELRTLIGIFNDAWSDNWGYVPFTQAEIDHAAVALRPVIVPELVIFVEVDDEAVGFILALTNINEALADLGGKLNLWTLPKLLWRLKIAGVGSLRVPLMGVKKRFRNHPSLGAGLAMIACDRLRETAKRMGKRRAELGWLLEDNKAANNILRSVGARLYKTHRLYEKALA